MEEIRKKVIIDTDIGDDIDDLFTLYLAASLKEIELIGVTTVYGNTNLRARQVNKFLSLSSLKNVKVYAGCGKQLKSLHPLPLSHVFCQYGEELDDESLKPINEDENCEGNQAVDYLVESAKKYKDNLTIVCIGPLTNLAKAIMKNKNAMRKCNVVLMGGCFSKIEKEWNIECDYKAAKIVFDAKLKLTAVGVDVTKKTEISAKLQNQILNTSKDEYTNYLVTCCNRWVKASGRRIILHDPLALYSIVDNELLKYKHYHVCVETKGKHSIGLTIPMEELLWVQFANINKEKFSVVRCASKVNGNKFIEVFKEQLGF